MSIAQALPHWDMTPVYPGLTSTEFETDMRLLAERVGALADAFRDHGVEKHDGIRLDQDTVAAFETVIERYSAFVESLSTLRVYIYAFVSTDTRDDLAQAKLSELQPIIVRSVQLGTQLTAWIGGLDVEGLIARSAVAREHAFLLRKQKRAAEHLMSPQEENLAAELSTSGGVAWAKLHDTLTSQILVPLETDAGVQDLPMSAVRNLAMDPERDVRRRAYEAEVAAWRRSAVPVAAALNSIKGESNTLNRRRGWDSALDLALFNNNIDRTTLDAMLQAARESFPDFRRYLHIKARALGVERLTWYDLFAPVGTATQVWDFEDATRFMLAQFGAYSDRLEQFATRALHERWIDAEPRPGKVDGGFCMPLRDDESRILVNYVPAYDGMATLAHELGHAYHNMNLASRPYLLRSAPNTLAETASIFCQTIVREAALQRADRGEQLAIIEAALQDSCQVVVDITSRFLFEQGLFEQRQRRELSVEELNSLMLQAQRDTYGDGLDESTLHPYMWAVKGHYYSVGRPFYNFPYMFGLLFGLGLYSRYRLDPDEFRAGYDSLLSSTGTADAGTLAQRFGIDIRTPDFWRESLDLVREDIERFQTLVEDTVG